MESSPPSLSSGQLKVLVFSKKCSWHLSNLLSNDNFSSSFLGSIPCFSFAGWLCLCRGPGCSQSRVRVVWYLLGTGREQSWGAGQQTPLLPADLPFSHTVRTPWLPAALWVLSISSAAAQDIGSGGL